MYGTQCNELISNIVFIRMFCTLFSNMSNYNKIQLTENWNAYFSNNNIIITSNKELTNINNIPFDFLG